MTWQPDANVVHAQRGHILNICSSSASNVGELTLKSRKPQHAAMHENNAAITSMKEHTERLVPQVFRLLIQPLRVRKPQNE